MTLYRGLLMGAAVAGLLLCVPALGIAVPQQSEPQQQQQQQAEQMKSVSGKVTSIASDKKSIQLAVNDGKDTHTMQFVIDQNTQVTGRVSTGANAIVQYQPTEDNHLLALVISPQSGSNQ